MGMPTCVDHRRQARGSYAFVYGCASVLAQLVRRAWWRGAAPLCACTCVRMRACVHGCAPPLPLIVCERVNVVGLGHVAHSSPTATCMFCTRLLRRDSASIHITVNPQIINGHISEPATLRRAFASATSVVASTARAQYPPQTPARHNATPLRTTLSGKCIHALDARRAAPRYASLLPHCSRRRTLAQLRASHRLYGCPQSPADALKLAPRIPPSLPRARTAP